MQQPKGFGVAGRANGRPPPLACTRASAQHIRIHMIATRESPGPASLKSFSLSRRATGPWMAEIQAMGMEPRRALRIWVRTACVARIASNNAVCRLAVCSLFGSASKLTSHITQDSHAGSASMQREIPGPCGFAPSGSSGWLPRASRDGPEQVPSFGLCFHTHTTLADASHADTL